MANKKEVALMKEYEFHGFDNEVQTLYIWESRDTQNPVEYGMLGPLERRIAKINPRYRVGILFEDTSSLVED